MFEYFTVQIPPNISVKMGQSQGAAASYLADVLGQYANNGWEFYSIETIGIEENAGCGCLAFLASLLGGKTQTFQNVYVIVFRKQKQRAATQTDLPPVQTS